MHVERCPVCHVKDANDAYPTMLGLLPLPAIAVEETGIVMRLQSGYLAVFWKPCSADVNASGQSVSVHQYPRFAISTPNCSIEVRVVSMGDVY